MGSFLGSFVGLVVTIVVVGFILYKALYYVFYVRARIRISKGLPPLPEPRPPRAQCPCFRNIRPGQAREFRYSA